MNQTAEIVEIDEPEVIETEIVEDEPKETEAEVVEAVEEEESTGVVSLDDEESPPQVSEAPAWVKDLRKKSKEDAKRIRELEEKLKAQDAPAKPKTLPDKPRLSDFDFDEDAFQAAMDGWYVQKREFEEHERQIQEAEKQKQAAAQAKQARYVEDKTSLQVDEYDELEDEVRSTLNPVQQALIVEGCKKPALFVASLAKSPKALKELAAITDPAEFAFEAGKLFGKLEAMQAKPKVKPAPETRVRAQTGVSVDDKLEKLRAEAEKTGDYTKVMAYKKQMRQK